MKNDERDPAMRTDFSSTEPTLHFITPSMGQVDKMKSHPSFPKLKKLSDVYHNLFVFCQGLVTTPPKNKEKKRSLEILWRPGFLVLLRNGMESGIIRGNFYDFTALDSKEVRPVAEET